MHKLSKAEITAQIVALQADLAESDGGVYEDPKTGRWFIVMRPPGRAKTTTRRRAPDGSRLTTRDQALIASGRRSWQGAAVLLTAATAGVRTEVHVTPGIRPSRKPRSDG